MKRSRRLVERVLRRRLSAWLHYFLWSRSARKDGFATESFGYSTQIEILNIWDSPLFPEKSSSTLFILGSGSSINDVTEEQFAHIKVHQSIGVNFWFFHDFVPNLFSFDAGQVDKNLPRGVEETLSSLGQLLARTEITSSAPSVLYLRPLNLDRKFLMPIPTSLECRSWVSGRANLIAEDYPTLEWDLKILLRSFFLGSTPPSVLPDNGSSIVRMVFLGLAQGFREIVLVGVDLDDRPHFWNSQAYVELYRPYVDLFPPPQQKPHGTVSTAGRPIGNIEFLATLGRVMEEEKIGRLWISSRKSQLASRLPQYDWNGEI